MLACLLGRQLGGVGPWAVCSWGQTLLGGRLPIHFEANKS